MNCTLAEFCTTDPELCSLGGYQLNVENSMTAEEFLNFGYDTPAAEELSENWEDELVQRHKNKATT